MAPSRAPGLDGLPTGFYNFYWKCAEAKLWEVLQECSQTGRLLASCRYVVLSLLPKKGVLAWNWRPVALLCTDYKLLSKVLANRLKIFLGIRIHREQSHCVLDTSIMVIFFSETYLTFDVGIVTIDQEKAFDRFDHGFLSVLDMV